MPDTTITTLADDYLSDFVVPGVPASGPKEPEKAQGRAAFAAVESRINEVEATASAGLIGGYTTLAALQADLDHPEGALAKVAGDPDPENDGVYRKSGASGAGSWTVFNDPTIEAAAAAEAAQATAEKWASEDEDVVVAGGEYSAKHYAAKSEGFKDAAEAAAASAEAVLEARRIIDAVTPSSGVLTIDVSQGDYFEVEVTEDVTSWAFTNLEAGRGERFSVVLKNRGFDVAWPPSLTWEEGSAPTLGDAYTSDTITLQTFDAGETWRASFSAQTNVGGDPHLVAALSLNPVWLYDHKDITSFFTDVAMTIPAAVGDPVRAIRDKSGNGHHRTTANTTNAGILRQSGDLYYVESDGVDDYMVTNSVDLTGTDAVTLCMGFRKLTDATLGIFFESSSTLGNNGTFGILAPPGAGAGSIRAASRGTASADASATSAAPVTNVVTLVSDISADSVALRLNKTASASSSGDQGTGNYSNTPHYFWRRGGSTFPAKVYDFGGALYASALSGADLALVENFVTDRSALPIAYPSGFTWSGGPTIVTNGTEYATTFDIDAMRPTTSVTYYIDPVAGSDSNDGLSTGAPRKKLSTTIALANAGGVAAKILCKPGVYRGDVGWYGAAPTVNVLLEPWATDPTDIANRIYFILPALPDAFVYDKGAGLPGFRCTGFYASDPWAVLDQKVLDEDGVPRKYEKAANYATYLATPGTWWREATGTYANRLFVNTFDGRDLRALSLAGQPHQIEVLTTGGGNNVRFDATTNLTLWMQNVCVIDGSNNVWIKDGTSGLTMTVYFKDVISVGSVLGDGMNFHALNANSTMRAYLLRCGAGYNLSDGFDYRADPAVPTAAAYGFEVECFTRRNGYDSSGANNASTGHGQSTIISLNCRFDGSQNRVVNDIESSKRLIFGGRVGASAQTDSTAVTIQAGSASGSHTAKIWIYGTNIEASAAAALYATTGAAIYYRGTDLAGLPLDGAGAIEPF